MENLIECTETHKLNNLTVTFTWVVNHRGEQTLMDVTVTAPPTEDGRGKKLCGLHPATLAAVAALAAKVDE